MLRLTIARRIRTAVLTATLGTLLPISPGAVSATPWLIGVNTPPVGTIDSYTTSFQTALVVGAPGVLANDIDLDGDPLVARLVAGPSHGTLSLAVNGSLQYQPDGGYSGLDAFSYRPYDGTAEPLVSTTVAIVIGPAPLSTPTPAPTPTAAPTPTPTPTPKPTPAPTASPTPAPTSTPAPSPTSAATPTSTPLQSLRPEPLWTPPPSSPPDALLTTPPGTPAPDSTATPSSPDPTSSPTSSQGAMAQLPIARDPPSPDGPATGAAPLFQDPDLAAVSFTTGNLALGIEWVVPTFLITVPGFLLIAIGLAQAVGGFIWMPLVRRHLDGDGRRSPRERMDATPQDFRPLGSGGGRD